MKPHNIHLIFFPQKKLDNKFLLRREKAFHLFLTAFRVPFAAARISKTRETEKRTTGTSESERGRAREGKASRRVNYTSCERRFIGRTFSTRGARARESPTPASSHHPCSPFRLPPRPSTTRGCRLTTQYYYHKTYTRSLWRAAAMGVPWTRA